MRIVCFSFLCCWLISFALFQLCFVGLNLKWWIVLLPVPWALLCKMFLFACLIFYHFFFSPNVSVCRFDKNLVCYFVSNLVGNGWSNSSWPGCKSVSLLWFVYGCDAWDLFKANFKGIHPISVVTCNVASPPWLWECIKIFLRLVLRLSASLPIYSSPFVTCKVLH